MSVFDILLIIWAIWISWGASILIGSLIKETYRAFHWYTKAAKKERREGLDEMFQRWENE